ncbi:hypothetical protein QTH91_14500 [Variovorax dokdonensis]|uniref:Uncharacterized protein n=1 Tax=Variovorax dokdonensis TaxID=344883 RepID=A0ABT7NCP5_9BURK|nr:hypothetical protein [Variovorax dokdonensis]MDM0045697.1 hypothetical protein [Variovorax dokdonensis]
MLSSDDAALRAVGEDQEQVMKTRKLTILSMGFPAAVPTRVDSGALTSNWFDPSPAFIAARAIRNIGFKLKAITI